MKVNMFFVMANHIFTCKPITIKNFAIHTDSVYGLSNILFYVLTINCYHSTRVINLAKEV